MKSKPIPEATRNKILDAAWRLIEQSGQVDHGQADIAAAAGVSRQTLYYAFGDKVGLLIAMVRHKDTLSDHVRRIGMAGHDRPDSPESLLEAAMAWLDYLPIIYPVGILLDAAALTDPAARAAWDDRMRKALLAGFRMRARRIHEAGHLPGGPDRIAEQVWALVHPSQWRLLVVEQGWPEDAFRQDRERLIRFLLGIG